MTLHLVPKPTGRPATLDPFGAIKREAGKAEHDCRRAIRGLIADIGSLKAGFVLSLIFEQESEDG